MGPFSIQSRVSYTYFDCAGKEWFLGDSLFHHSFFSALGVWNHNFPMKTRKKEWKKLKTWTKGTETERWVVLHKTHGCYDFFMLFCYRVYWTVFAFRRSFFWLVQWFLFSASSLSRHERRESIKSRTSDNFWTFARIDETKRQPRNKSFVMRFCQTIAVWEWRKDKSQTSISPVTDK